MENTQSQLGSGSIAKLYLKLALPAVVAQLINLLYNIVDRIYIGHIPEVGASALTGLGLFMPILMLMNAFAMLAAAGGAPMAAIAMGSRDNERAEKIMANCFTLLLIFAVALTAVFYLAAPALLRFFGASDVTLPYALDYARIYILGAFFVLMVLGMNPFITTQGFAKISMLTTIIGAVLMMLSVFAKGEQTTRKFLLANASVWTVYTGIVGSSTFVAEVGAVIADCIALYKYRGTEQK